MHQSAGVSVSELRRWQLTLPQAASVLGVDLGAVRKTVDRGWLKPSYIPVKGRSIRALNGLDIVCLIIHPSVAPKLRRLVYDGLKHWPEDRLVQGNLAVQIDEPGGSRTVDVRLDRPVREALVGMQALERSRDAVDDEGFIRGTGIEAHRIAALIKGEMHLDEVLRDYPNLSQQQVDSAVAFSRAHPRPGRPYPGRTAKSALRKRRGGLALAFAAAQRHSGEF